MPLVKTSQNNLIGGVSQQPTTVRGPDKCVATENSWPSPVDGLVKRQPTSHIAKVLTSIPSTARMHIINRDPTEQYAVIFDDTDIQVFDLSDGTEVPVVDNTGGTFDYLSTMVDKDDLGILTVADFTFVTNRLVTPAMGVATSSATPTGASDDAFIFVRQGNYASDYEVEFEFNSVVYNTALTVTTWDGITSLTGTGNINSVKTEDIAAELKVLIDNKAVTDLTVTQQGSVLRLQGANSKTFDYVITGDSVGDSVLSVVHRQVPRVQGYLPEICYHDFKVEVIGDAEVDGDDYWVEFVADDSTTKPFGRGYWQEAVAPGVTFELDEDTMPHQLVRTFNGGGGSKQFEWDVVAWEDRDVGDTTTNPDPSFVGTAIEEIFFYKDRLGFLSGENINLSETSEYFNFFRVTLLNLRDTANIDVTVRHTLVSLLKRAVPFNEDMLLWSDRSQFLLRGGDILSPRTVQVIPIAEFESLSSVSPVSAGRSVFFPFQRGDQSGVRELYQAGDVNVFDAADISAEVPNYIEGNISLLAGSTLEDTLCATSDDSDSSHLVWVYKYLWSGDQRVLSSWGLWSFGTGATVHSLQFIDNDLYLLIQRGTDLFVEKLTLATGLTDASSAFISHLDRRVEETDLVLVYDSGADETTATFPYTLDPSTQGWVYDVITKGGLNLEVLSQSGTDVVLRGDHTAATLWAGMVYEMSYEFSPPVIKVEAGGGVLAELSLPQKLGRGFLAYHGSRYFTVEVTIKGRDTYTYTFNGLEPSFAGDTVENTDLRDGEFNIPVMGEAAEATIVIKNDSPFPSNFASVVWETNTFARATRAV